MKKESKTSSVWEDNYSTAQAFYKKNGHFPTHKENRRIRQWANVWYHKYADENPDKLRMLLDIGYQIPDKWYLWNQNYRFAKEFLAEHGRPLRHADNNKVWRYFRVWAGNSGKQHPERINMLREIGIIIKAADSVWQKNFDRAKAFFEQNGHFPTRKENIILSEWARQWEQRMGQENPSMLAMLESIGYESRQKAAI